MKLSALRFDVLATGIFRFHAPAYAPANLPSPAPIQQTVAYNQYPNDYCREYESVVTINGVSQRSHGIACYRPDGSWRINQ